MIKCDSKIRKIFSAYLLLTFAINQSALSILAADISLGGPLKTNTNVNTLGNITDISTNTSVNGGKTGINSFGRFNVNNGDIVNLNLINNQNKLVNLIFDDSASQINGVVNSYMNGSIGGNVLFANPNGFVVGQNGVFNVGSLTLMTPTVEAMKELINYNVLNKPESYNDTNVERLISFTFNDQNYIVTGNEYYPYQLAPSAIDIQGKINSGGGIDLISGSKVDLAQGSELNANMAFNVSNGVVTATPKTPISYENINGKYPEKFAMQDGKNIIIVASNNNATDDKLSAIVNLNGQIKSNGGDVVVRTEALQLGGNAEAQSEINVKSSSNINANNVFIDAVSKVSNIHSGIKDNLYDNFVADIVALVADQIVHVADVKTAVNIEQSAVIDAINDVTLSAMSDLDIESGATLAGTLPNFNLNVTNISAKTNAIVKSGANITSKNFKVAATTDLNLKTTTKSTNLIDKATGKDLGSYALGVTVTDLNNKAEIEKDVVLNVGNDIDVLAQTTSYHKDIVQNGLIPVVDKNSGPVGAAVSVIVTNSVNEAIMNADASINGSLNVEADYIGNIVSSVYGYSGTGSTASGGTAEDGIVDKLWKHTKSIDKIDSVITRSNAKYNNIDVAGAIGVIVDKVTSVAKIGNRDDSDATKNIKPEISAAQVQVKSATTDYKSNLYVQAEAEQGATAAGGAIAINYKDLNSNANAYGDFTLSGSTKSTVFTTSPTNEVVNEGNFYKKENDSILLTEEQYNKLKDKDKDEYSALDSSVKIYRYVDGDKILYTDNANKRLNYSQVSGIYYQKDGIYISQAEYNKLSNTEKTLYSQVQEPLYFYYKNGNSVDALSVISTTDIIHPMAWLDWIKTFLPFFEGDTYSNAWQEVKNHWNSVETNNTSDYLSYLSSIGELSNIIDEGGFDIFNAIDFNNLGAYGFFNTFAQSKASAQTQQGDTKAFSGALALALFNASAEAVLDNNSSVLLQATDVDKAKVNVSAVSNNEIWTASTLMDLMNFNKFLSGATARDGSAYGISGAFTYSDSNVIAKIGDNVKISTDDSIDFVKRGDVNVMATEDGNFLTLSAGSSSPDKTGLSGSIGMTVLGNGIVKATIEKDSKINANNLNVLATKDDNFINAVIAFANGQNSYGFGLSGIILTDSVESYIAGQINALESINLKADYDKLIVNANANVGIAKEGSDDPVGKKQDSPDAIEDYYGLRDLFNEDDSLNSSKWAKKEAKINQLTQEIDKEYDWTRPLNPDKETSSKAGGINLNLATNSVKATVKDGANLTAQKDINVNANSNDTTVNANAVVAANGKSGAGGTIMADISKSTVEATVGNAVLNAKKAINVTAKEDYNLIAASAGVATADDKAGAGNVSSAVQVNKVTAGIQDGAKINEILEDKEQSVKVEAQVDSDVIKAVGALAVQAGGKGDSASGSVGGTIDGDVVCNEINAYIKDSNVNAVKSIDVNAINQDKLIVVDVAGSASTQDSAYGGTIGAYVAVNDVNAYIENSNINTKTFANTADLSNQEVNLNAESKFNEVAVVGTVAAGNKTGVGASIRVDAIVNDVNSYIKNSTVNAFKQAKLVNNDTMSRISVSVAGAGSTNKNAGAGVISILADVTDQNNYIENSTLTVGDLVLDTDKVLNTVAVTGAIAVAANGTSVGLSGYGVGVSHEINTYIKNSNITSSNDIKLISNFAQDFHNIIFGGAGGKGFAGSGAISVLVNDSDMNTYILAENNSEKKDITSKDGQVLVSSASKMDMLTVDGNVAISMNNSSAGVATNTMVNKANITAGIEGANLSAKKGVDILGKSTQEQLSTVVGAAGGKEVSAQGSVDTIVISQNIDAYIKNAIVKSGGNISVRTEDTFNSKSIVGALNGSTSGLAFGASVLTATFGGENKAHIDNSSFDDFDEANSLKELIVKSTQSDIFTGVTVAGSLGAKAGVGGAIDTIVLNKTVSSYIDNSQNINNSKFSKTTVLSDANTDLTIGAGSLGVGGNVGVGGTISTVVINKHINSLVKNNSDLNVDEITIISQATDNIEPTAVAGSGAGSYAVSGVVGTTVVNSNMQSGIKDSSVDAKKIDIDTIAKAKYRDITGAVSGAGTVGVGASIITNVVGYDLSAFVSNSTITDFDSLDVNANANTAYEIYAISGALAGTAGVAGVVETNVVNNSVNSYVTGSIKGKKLAVNAGDTVDFVKGVAGSLAGGGTAGVGATISTNSVTSTVIAYIGSNGDNEIKVDNIEVKSTGLQKFNDLYAMGFGAGQTGIGATSLVNIADATVKSYVLKNSRISSSDKLKIEADNATTITETIVSGGGAIYAAGGASVGVNKMTNVVESYTEDNVTLNTASSDFNATSTTNLGTKDKKLSVHAGSIAGYGSLAGAVLVNTVNNKVNSFIGKNNVITSTGNLNLNATANTNIYETVGGYSGAGLATLGASVGVNSINNTVNAFIASGSSIETGAGDLIIKALSNEIIDAKAIVVGGAAVALNGGILYNTIGNTVGNAQSNDLTDDDAKVYETAKKQADNLLIASATEQNNADENFKEYSGIETEDTFSLFTKSENSGSAVTYRENTTSAFVDTGARINTNNLEILAENTNDINIVIDGITVGVAAVGVAAGVSNVYTTTNAFVSNNVVNVATGKIDISSKSNDKQKVYASAAAGGIVSGSGGVAKINSNKTTNAYVLESSILEATKDFSLKAISNGNISSIVDGDSHGGVAVGVSVANAIIKGDTKIDIAENVTITSKEGNLTIEAKTEEQAKADADALVGSLIGGVGAEANAQTGKTNTINIGKNANIFAKLAAKISSIGKNASTAITDGRAYSVVSAGGTKTNALIENNNGVVIADADVNSNKLISAKSIDITSSVENNANASTEAGAGAIVGIGGSGVYTNINSNNKIKIGKNYAVSTTDGAYSVNANTSNVYKAYNNSSAAGVVGVTAGIIGNTVNSIVDTVSNANIVSAGAIYIGAANKTIKDSATNYDLYGGSGGVVGIGCANLADVITMIATAELGGDKAYANGANENGYVSIFSDSVLNVNEKVDVDAVGGIPVADGNVKVETNVTTKTTVFNKDIKSDDDNIYFLANSDIDIYTKSNVEASGIASGAGGDSIAKNNSAITSVIVNSGVKSISGRDTYIQAICDNDIQAYIDAVSCGFVGVIGNSAATAYNNSIVSVTIAENAVLKSYDSMNLAAYDSTKNLIAKRNAKGSIFWGIRIKGKGGKPPINISPKAIITLNGSLESGLGANRNLVINEDGTYTSDGIKVIGNKVKQGEYTTADVTADIKAYEKSKDSKLTQYDNDIATLETAKSSAQDKKTNVEAQLNVYESENAGYENSINNIDLIIVAWDDNFDNDSGTLVAESFGNALSNIDDSYLSQVKTAYSNYINDSSEENLTALKTAVNSLDSIKTNLNNSIDENATSISTYRDALSSLITTIDNYDSLIREAEAEKTEISAFYNGIIDQLTAQKNSGTNIDVYSFELGDVYVRSGETNVDAKIVNGTGSITAPGNKFSINVENKSVSDVVYHDLVIDKSVRGGIYGDNIADTITKTIINNGEDYTISITNLVDANDPTVLLDLANGYGDMVFKGVVENINGLVSFSNNTGNVLSNNTITAKDLKIFVPNGDYTQSYTNSSLNIGGSNNSGAILSSGNIDISSKIINVNGLIQSGSEIKSVTIPEFTVEYDAVEGKLYQIVNGNKTEMEKGSTDGYYYINIEASGKANAQLETIKAYFKITDDLNDIDNLDCNNINGEIVLFNTAITGGNITLTGNIISTSNNGEIVLVNGYGHIDVVNNSDFILNTSTLDASSKIAGKLTINDFKFSDTDKAGSYYDNITQNNIDDSNWLSEHADTYIVKIDGDGLLTTVDSENSLGNSYFDRNSVSNSTREDGANITSINYVPGDDSYYVTATTTTKTYMEYVKRSWWTELWHGKLYKAVEREETIAPVYGVANNPIKIQFQGFDTPEINVISNDSIIMNKNIGALTGNVNLTSNLGSISTDSVNYSILAQNITLNALNGDIGLEIAKNIQISLNDNGSLIANANDVAVNLLSENLYDLDITATNRAYINTNGDKLGNDTNKFKVNADDVQLFALNGTIDLDSSKNSQIDIVANKLRAEAADDITIVLDNDLLISNVTSNKQGTIYLSSQTGSILAADDANYILYKISGGNVILKAIEGHIGTSEKSVKFGNDSVVIAEAKGDINLSSMTRIYTDLIRSTEGSVNLDADYGIIASPNSEGLVYNIASATGVNLNSKSGNIENIVINTDGTINASAGYTNGIASGMSDIVIYLLSKEMLDNEYLASLTEEEVSAEIEKYTNGLKDMKIGTIKASKDIFIYSEKSILNTDANSSLTGEHITLSSAEDIGSDDSAIKLNANRYVTAYAGTSVYLASDNDLKINRVSSNYGKLDTNGNIINNGLLENIVINSNSNIINAAMSSENDEEPVNLVAKNINLNATKDIGSVLNYFTVETQSTETADGSLSFTAENAYIKGINSDLNIVSSNVVENSYISSEGDVTINDLTVGGALTSSSENINVIGSLAVSESANVNANDTITIADSANVNISGDLNANASNINIGNINLSGNLNSSVDNLILNTSNDLNIGSISGNSNNYVENINIVSGKSIYNGLNSSDTNIYGKNINMKAINNIGTESKPLNVKLVDGNNIAMEANHLISVSTNGADTNWSSINTGDLVLKSENNINIDNLDVDTINLTTSASNLAINSMDIEDSGTLKVGNKKIAINNKSFAPIFDADLQMYLAKNPTYIKIDDSNNIRTDIINSVRKGQNILINSDIVNNSMESSIVASIESALKNTNVANKTIESTNSMIYYLPTEKSYKKNAKQRYGQPYIRNQFDEIVTPENIFDVINISEYKKFKNRNLNKVSKKL